MVSLRIFTTVFFSVYSVHTFQFVLEKDSLIQLNYSWNAATCNYLFPINISLHQCHPEQLLLQNIDSDQVWSGCYRLSHHFAGNIPSKTRYFLKMSLNANVTF